MRLQKHTCGRAARLIGGILRRQGPWIPILALILLTVACKGSAPEVTVDAPELAASMRYLARSAIVCVVIAGGVVIWTTVHRQSLSSSPTLKGKPPHGHSA